jgi:hypothetical protein
MTTCSPGPTTEQKIRETAEFCTQLYSNLTCKICSSIKIYRCLNSIFSFIILGTLNLTSYSLINRQSSC